MLDRLCVAERLHGQDAATQAAKARLYSFLRAKYIKRFAEEHQISFEEAFSRQDSILGDSKDFAREAAALGIDPREPPLADHSTASPHPLSFRRRDLLEDEETFLQDGNS